MSEPVSSLPAFGAHKNSRDTPTLADDSKPSFLFWLDDMELWDSVADMPKSKKAAMVIVVALKKAPTTHKLAISGWRSNRQLWSGDDGLELLLGYLKSELKVQNFTERTLV